MGDGSGEYLTLTYVELGERLGITSDSARLKAKKKVDRGEWSFVPRNSDRDPVRVRVPMVALPEHPPERSPERRQDDSGHRANGIPSIAEVLTELGELKASVAELHGVRAEVELATAQVAEIRLKAAVAEAERDAARANAVIEVESMRKQLESGLKAMEAGIAARNAVIEEVKETLAHERARSERLETMLAELHRPWWRRWMG
jgi:hypothetical protein